MRTRVTGFLIALAIVTIASVGTMVVGQFRDTWPWPWISAPIVPAWFLVVWMCGGPHGFALEAYEGTVAIFGVALLMWWALIEGFRRVWRRLRPRTNATAPPV